LVLSSTEAASFDVGTDSSGGGSGSRRCVAHRRSSQRPGASDGVAVARRHGDASRGVVVHAVSVTTLFSHSHVPNFTLRFLRCPILLLGFFGLLIAWPN